MSPLYVLLHVVHCDCGLHKRSVPSSPDGFLPARACSRIPQVLPRNFALESMSTGAPIADFRIF